MSLPVAYLTEMAPPQPKPTRKRNRKRKRRIISDASSSEDDSSSSSSSSDESHDQKLKPTVTIPVRKPKAAAPASAEEDEGESTSDEDEDSSASEVDATTIPTFSSSKLGRTDLQNNEPPPHRHSPSPSPPPTADIPPFIPQDSPEGERILKERFRKFWMASLAEGFKDDLEEIRKEPNLGPSRLALLIESLASGAEVFSSSSTGGGVNEMEVVLDQLS